MSSYLKTSEYVTIGHPDKVADYISEYILDRIIESDPEARYAVECQIKDFQVTLAGELTTKIKNPESKFKEWARQAVSKIGYDQKYVKRFGIDCTIFGDGLDVNTYISTQSPDIALGVNRQGWGDQGIFFGMWDGSTEEGFGKDYAMAKWIGQYLYKLALTDKYPLGIDIKTQATYDEIDKKFTKIIIAIPTTKGTDTKSIEKEIKGLVRKKFPELKGAKFIINGTGLYQVHGPIGDSGTTGRKLVVDFYGSGSRIGGGSPWTKDGTKADLTLNMFARELAGLAYFQWKQEMPRIHKVETELSCCIGKQEVLCITTAFDDENIPIHRVADERKVPTEFLIERYGLNKPKFAYLCEEGLFTEIDQNFVSAR